MRWFLPANYGVVPLILIISLLAVVLAWNSYGLLMVAMANVGYLQRSGLMGVVDGGLVQFVVICGKALISLFSYLGFKGIESELIRRWLDRNGR